MEALISEVHERNALWNKRNPHYKDPKSKSGDSRDCAATYLGKWHLLFLKDTVVPRDTEGNTSLLEVSEDTQVCKIESEFNENEDWEETASMDSNAIVSLPQESLNEILTPPVSQPTENPLSLSKRLSDTEAKKLALLQTPEDENSLFLRSLLQYLKRMDPFQQLRVRTKFRDILLQEMSQDQSSSFQTSGTSCPIMGPSTAVSSVQSNYSNISSPTSPTNSAYSNNPPSLSDHNCYSSLTASPHGTSIL
ncbi:uncharacterized protein LOC111861971 [Cryptotermes secundus]|uniref:uncharacterized protein LOC111861971 n=1 Tax=Cryptotermes secundus TaxID=105785 RepID=UPI001454C04E|nr:uncharacterized protein LOC111861971 [Cryptotermes secundus]